MERNEQFEKLFQKYLDKTCSQQERDELFQYIKHAKFDDDLKELLERSWNKEFAMHEQSNEQANSIFKNILEYKGDIKNRKIIPLWRKWAVAASIVLALGAGSFFLFFHDMKQSEIAQTQEKRFKNDIEPGKYKAKLTLANGNIIILDSAATGELTREGETSIENKDGRLIYRTGASGANEILYNTLTTSRGETYATVLADGSKVWLNSGSSIKYPVAFVGNERKVEITGEAYFEVTHNQKIPFKVQLPDGSVVEDLGTEFNINAYSNEGVIRTTLINGIVKVTLLKHNKEIAGTNSKVLNKTGQQASIDNGQLAISDHVNLEETLAWKNGRFYFENSSVETIMKQVERWYDVEVVFEDKIPNLFVASIPRDLPVSELLKLLELTERVHFRIEGKKITVMK